MKTLYIVFTLVSFLYSCHSGKNHIESNTTKDFTLNLKTSLKGTYYYLDVDSINYDNSKFIYSLIEVKLTNNTNSEIRFITYTCITAANVVVDSKDVVVCMNFCPSNSQVIYELKPDQEFSMPVILRTTKAIQNPIKIGFILLDPKVISSNQFFSTINNSRDRLENVLWSEPILLGLNYQQPSEIK